MAWINSSLVLVITNSTRVSIYFRSLRSFKTLSLIWFQPYCSVFSLDCFSISSFLDSRFISSFFSSMEYFTKTSSEFLVFLYAFLFSLKPSWSHNLSWDDDLTHFSSSVFFLEPWCSSIDVWNFKVSAILPKLSWLKLTCYFLKN